MQIAALYSPIAASTSALNTLAGSYSTTIGGKSYAGSVQYSDGTYTASVPNLPGAVASGSSAQAAENNLNVRIDILV